MTVEVSFTTSGDVSDPLEVPAGRQAKLGVAGTFTGRVEMQRQVGSSGWSVVGTLLAAGALTVDDGTYRAVARGFSSGQADVTLAVLAQSAGAAGTANLGDTLLVADGGDAGAPESLTLQQVFDIILANLPSGSAAATPSLRALGTTATKAAAGNDARLSDTRTPTDDSVTAAKIAADAVTTVKILDGNVTEAKLADGAVVVAKLAADAVETAKIKDANVTLAKIANIAAATFLGNNTGAPAAPIALTVAEVLAALGIVIDTYTPGLTLGANAAAAVAAVTQYLRVGGAVIVAGTLTIDPTTTATTTVVDIDLPIASDLGALADCAGVAASVVSSTIQAYGMIFGETTGNKARLQMVPVDVASRTWAFIFMYRII